MSRIIYVNGRYLPYAQAQVHVEDRGYQFADAIYEVCEVLGGRLVDETRHIARLNRSLGELSMGRPMSDKAIGRVMREVVRRNKVREGWVYLQVSRGVAPRDFLFPEDGTPHGMVCLARSVGLKGRNAKAAKGIGVTTMPEMRWKRPDIKTTQLLASSLAKQKAAAEGASEAWFVDEQGFVTEGASSNAWIITRDGELITRQADHSLLRGVTRTGVFDVVAREKLILIERPFTVAEAQAAREAFVTSASALVMPVVAIDGRPVANGAPGSITLEIRRMFHELSEIADR